jgi:hypothetical protein
MTFPQSVYPWRKYNGLCGWCGLHPINYDPDQTHRPLFYPIPQKSDRVFHGSFICDHCRDIRECWHWMKSIRSDNTPEQIAPFIEMMQEEFKYGRILDENIGRERVEERTWREGIKRGKIEKVELFFKKLVRWKRDVWKLSSFDERRFVCFVRR